MGTSGDIKGGQRMAESLGGPLAWKDPWGVEGQPALLAKMLKEWGDRESGEGTQRV